MKLSCSLFLTMIGYFTSTTQGITIPSLSESDIIAIETEQNESSPGPLKFAQPHAVSINACTHGKWNKNTWVLYVASPGAKSLNFGFSKLNLPEGAVMSIKSALKDSTTADVVVNEQVNDNGEYWTRVIDTERVNISIEYSGKYMSGRPCDDFELVSINVGFRSFGGDKSGSCNIDVVCPERAGWEAEIKSVAGVSFGGSLFCTGTMINNSNQDEIPYILTADHCGIRDDNVGSLVTYWNFETSICAGFPDGSLDQSTTGGGNVLVRNPQSDMTLIQLNNSPVSDYGVTFAGWDNTPEEYTLPGVCIHHPSGDEKRISFEDDAITSTSYGGSTATESGTHIRVADWNLGTTESGSSGSPLFNGNHHIIGQLHGGSAACGNNLPDWYGRFSLSWSATNIGDYLDPQGTLNGVYGSVDTYDPYAFPTTSPKPTNAPTFPLPTESPTPCPGFFFKLDILTDDYGGEISWTLTDLSDDDIILSVPQSTYSNAQRYEVDECVDFGCYRFDIYDSFGDGICCRYNKGEYTITVNGVVVGSGGDYDFSDFVEFCNDPSVSPTTAQSSAPTTDIPSILPSGTPSIVPSAEPNDIPSMLPSGTPSIAPSAEPTHIPSMLLPSGTPSIAPSNASSLCIDSMLNAAANGDGYDCSSFLDSNVCAFTGAQSHCPLSCSACSVYQCLDSFIDFKTPTGTASCSMIASLDDDRKKDYCEFEAVYSTCRSTCAYCDNML